MRHRLVPAAAAALHCSQLCLNNRVQCVARPFNPRRNRSSWHLAKFGADAAAILAAALSPGRLGGIQRRALREHHRQPRFTAQYARGAFSG